MIIQIWLFAPGAGQVGDGVSRNPPDRDAARDAAENCELPKTLQGISNLTTERNKDSTQIDDSESVTQQFRLTCDELVRQAPLKPDEVLGCQGRACQRPVGGGIPEVQCLFVPNAYQGAVDVDSWYDFKICGKDF